jgi:hypothetical protein
MNKFLAALEAEKMRRLGKVVNKQTTNYEDLSLSELRKKFPDISARSKAEFIKKIEA